MSQRNKQETLLDRLQHKRLDWSEEENDEDVQFLLLKESLTMDELARCVIDLISRCEVDIDVPQNSFHFKSQKELIDILFRPELVSIIVSSNLRDSSDEDEDEDDDEEEGETTDLDGDQTDPPEAHPEMKPKATPKATPKEAKADPPKKFEEIKGDIGEQVTHLSRAAPQQPANPFQALREPDEDNDEEEDEGEWKTVENKKKKAKLVSSRNKQDMTFYVFRDDANNSFMDFIGIAKDAAELQEMVKDEKWAHGYAPTNDVVYDFNRLGHEGKKFRMFVPNSEYLQKFRAWYVEYSKNGFKDVDDACDYYVFQEKSDWHEWTFLKKVKGLKAARAVVKSLIIHKKKKIWAHAFTPADNVISDFILSAQGLTEEWFQADDDYVKRFHEVFETLKL